MISNSFRITILPTLRSNGLGFAYKKPNASAGGLIVVQNRIITTMARKKLLTLLLFVTVAATLGKSPHAFVQYYHLTFTHSIQFQLASRAATPRRAAFTMRTSKQMVKNFVLAKRLCTISQNAIQFASQVSIKYIVIYTRFLKSFGVICDFLKKNVLR